MYKSTTKYRLQGAYCSKGVTVTLPHPAWRGGTHSDNQNSTLMWRNTLCRPEIKQDVVEHILPIKNDKGRGGTHSADRNWPGRGGTHFANRKLTWDVAEHTLPTWNRPWRSVTVRDYERKARSALRFFHIDFIGPVIRRLGISWN